MKRLEEEEKRKGKIKNIISNKLIKFNNQITI